MAQMTVGVIDQLRIRKEEVREEVTKLINPALNKSATELIGRFISLVLVFKHSTANISFAAFFSAQKQHNQTTIS